MEKEKENVLKQGVSLPPRLVAALADEVAKTLVKRLPHMFPHPRSKTKGAKKADKKLEGSYFLDTSAIIDGRIFDVISLGLIKGSRLVILDSIFVELKHIVDTQDAVKRERGKNGLSYLDKLKKTKQVKVVALSDNGNHQQNGLVAVEVDEKLIASAKKNKGKIITCDYNLEKKASIEGVTAINVNAMAHALKVRAVPGESIHVKILHVGKDASQGVGYLDDGTMIVVEHGSIDISKTINVVIARVIQTAAGRILFAKKI